MIRASNKSGLGPIVVGEGEHTYEVEHDWGRLPPELAYGNTHGFIGSYTKTSHSISCIVLGQEGGEMQRDYHYSAARDAAALDANRAGRRGDHARRAGHAHLTARIRVRPARTRVDTDLDERHARAARDSGEAGRRSDRAW